MTELNELNKLHERISKGRLFVISAPSGAGKTTLVRILNEELERAVYSVSVTSRQPRPGEVDGKDYVFVNEDEFMRMVEENKLLEWANVHGNYYGTSRGFVEDNIEKGKYIILDIDVQGGMQIKEKFPDAVLIFVMPPSMEELGKRLNGRNQDSQEEIKKRLNNAYAEMEYAPKYDYQVINEELKDALDKIKSIIVAEECRVR
jgi:guanylate kinase